MPKREFRITAAVIALTAGVMISLAWNWDVPARRAPERGVAPGASGAGESRSWDSGDLGVIPPKIAGSEQKTESPGYRSPAGDDRAAGGGFRSRPPITASRSGERIQYAAETRASWYGPGFHGFETANGERFDQGDLTAAHRTLPFDTLVLVTNLENGRQVAVRINDRGPFIEGRDIDLSRKAFESIAPLGQGIAAVRLDVLRK